MSEVTLSIAVLLAAGLLFAKVAQLIKLPSVTGFILAGLVLGPSGLGLITSESVGHKLDHFTQIALMLIAFGIGEHIELRRLGAIARDVTWISIVQALGTFVMVTLGTLLAAWLLAGPGGRGLDPVVLALLLGAVAVATAPAAILHLVREMGARGPLTSTLMAVVAVDDGLAIMIFGLAVSVAHQIVGPGAGTPVQAVVACVSEIFSSLAIGVLTGLLIDYLLNKFHKREEMLTGGLALLLLCGETTRLLHLSPLLAGMAAGFIIINRAERDVRLFRAINAFEPPIYVLFFTLAGVHLDLAALKLAGWLGLVYFVTRIIGKYTGAWLGAVLSGAPARVRNYLGLALIPQAGVAIGLVFMISSDPQLDAWSAVITPVVLAGVVFSELFGPLLARYTLERAGEGETVQHHPECGTRSRRACNAWLRGSEGISFAPWTGGKLHPASRPSGVVVFGAFHFATVRGLARTAAILAHYYHALPLAVRVSDRPEQARQDDGDLDSLFLAEKDETASMGYPLLTEVIHDAPAAGLVAAAERGKARAIVLGYPVDSNPQAFQRVIDQVVAGVSCPVVAVRFSGTFRCERILVPFLFPFELDELLPILEAMAMTTQPRITFLHLLHHDSSEEEVAASDQELQGWLATNLFDTQTRHLVEAAESRLETILQTAEYHDIVIMTAARRYGFNRMFFGSLSSSVVRSLSRPVLVLCPPGKPADKSSS